MRTILVACLLLCFLISCSKEKQQKEPLELYEPSELALLMEELYVYNDSIKQQILRGTQLDSLPLDLQLLHTAEMSANFERDEAFRKYAGAYTYFQERLNSTSVDSLKLVYNNTINLCINCHQMSCTGPIPRIKKLLIE